MTRLGALITALQRAADYNRNDQVGPAAVLWTDKDRQWLSLLLVLRTRLPLLTYGDYDPSRPHTACTFYGTIQPCVYYPGENRIVNN
jgi:hypothetical protein